MLQLQSALGIFALLAIAWAFGENRRAVSLRQAAIGLAATLVTAVVLIKLPIVAHAFGAINDAVAPLGISFSKLPIRIAAISDAIAAAKGSAVKGSDAKDRK